jgi:hypothetical protein
MNRRIAAIALSLTLSGCAPFAASLIGERFGVPLTEKVVSSKVEPNTLVAIDGASCMVSEKKWEKAKVGKNYLCVWSRGRDAIEQRAD